jgi:hypothetical protein
MQVCIEIQKGKIFINDFHIQPFLIIHMENHRCSLFLLETNSYGSLLNLRGYYMYDASYDHASSSADIM